MKLTQATTVLHSGLYLINRVC